MSQIARKTKGAEGFILSKSYPPNIEKTSPPRFPNRENAPVMVPLISLGIPCMNRTSMLTLERTDETISRQHRLIENGDPGFVTHIKPRPLMARSPNANGMITLEDTRSPRVPKTGSNSRVEATPHSMMV